MSNRLTAMVIGAGSAGEGHSIALKQAGVDVVAIASRTEAAVRKVAAMLEIPTPTTDWRTTLAKVRPDIVAVATPADSHADIIQAAIELKAHIYVDKPLAPSAREARKLSEAAGAAGIKTAYAATSNYQPSALLARDLVREGAIGKVVEAEFVSHYRWPTLAPFGWAHRLATGGGRLNNNFTHKLAIAQSVIGGTTLAAAGETRNDLKRAPVGEAVHDFRQWHRAAPTPQEAAGMRFETVDSDWSYTVLARIGRPGTPLEDSASVTFRHSALRKALTPDYVAFYGTEGTIHVEKAYCQGDVFLWRDEDGSDFKKVPLPDRISQWLPPVHPLPHWNAGWEIPQRAWNTLAREFVADIQGRPHEQYFTMRDGWLFQEVIDIVRRSRGWESLPSVD